MTLVFRTRCGCEREIQSDHAPREYLMPLKPLAGVVTFGEMWPKITPGMTATEMRQARAEHERKVFGPPQRRRFERVKVRGTRVYYDEIATETETSK
jgi:hypothetical protein